MAVKDPDDVILAIFRHDSVKNERKSAEAGRPIFDDIELCELRYPGSKNTGVYPALGFARWVIDPETGEQVKQTYAERFSRQYQQFKRHSAQTKAGTPLTFATFLTEARRAELRAQNVYTMEQLAAIDGQELKNLGPSGREYKNQAVQFLEEAAVGAPNTKLAAELEALRAKNDVLESDLKLLQEAASRKADEADDDFNTMSNEQLRSFIEANTGHAPKGLLNRKTLMRMARDCSPENTEAA
jgi:hypothetical protein